MAFPANCLATTIGSVPLSDAREAAQLILTYTPEIPAWPQLAKRPREGMILQFTEGLPGLVRTPQKVYFDTTTRNFHDEVIHFYEDFFAIREGNNTSLLEKFSLTPQYAEGFHALVDALTRHHYPLFALKGQITGPFTLATTLTDQDGKSAFYTPELRDIIVKMICLKAQWQIQKLRFSGVPVIISIDEPSLVGFGSSAHLGITAEDVQKDLSDVIALIHSEEGFAAIHCCENTDWSLLFMTDTDIISFDAYSFFDKVILYADALKRFLSREGILAWGLIPTSSVEKLHGETVSSLVEKWHTQVQRLKNSGTATDTIASRSLITPSCGTGSLSREDALKVFQLLKEVSRELRKCYFN